MKDITFRLYKGFNDPPEDYIHEETLLLPEEAFGSSEYNIFIKKKYVREQVMPYFELLYDYGSLCIEYPFNLYVKKSIVYNR